MGIGGGGGGGVEFFVNLGSFEGGVEGSEEKRLNPGSDATMAIYCISVSLFLDELGRDECDSDKSFLVFPLCFVEGRE